MGLGDVAKCVGRWLLCLRWWDLFQQHLPFLCIHWRVSRDPEQIARRCLTDSISSGFTSFSDHKVMRHIRRGSLMSRHIRNPPKRADVSAPPIVPELTNPIHLAFGESFSGFGIPTPSTDLLVGLANPKKHSADRPGFPGDNVAPEAESPGEFLHMESAEFLDVGKREGCAAGVLLFFFGCVLRLQGGGVNLFFCTVVHTHVRKSMSSSEPGQGPSFFNKHDQTRNLNGFSSKHFDINGYITFIPKQKNKKAKLSSLPQGWGRSPPEMPSEFTISTSELRKHLGWGRGFWASVKSPTSSVLLEKHRKEKHRKPFFLAFSIRCGCINHFQIVSHSWDKHSIHSQLVK